MATPILIDTDMGVDDAVAIALALAARELRLRALVATGGNVNLDQATRNIGRLLGAIQPPKRPLVGRGLDQSDDLMDARHVFGSDGLGEAGIPDAAVEAADFREVYRRAIDEAGGELVVVAIGPLTTLAAMLAEDASRLRKVRQVVVMGGALWCKGNVRGVAEFNFYRDPAAAAAVLSAGFPLTLVPLDVTTHVTLDESHVAHLAASGTRAGALLAKIMPFPMRHSNEAGPGRFIVHDALAIGALGWPGLFLKTQLAVDVSVGGHDAGRTRPKITHEPGRGIDVLTAVNAADFIEKMLECLCQEEFVV